MRFFFLLALLVCSAAAGASSQNVSSGVIEKFLWQVKNKAAELKISDLEEQSSSISVENSLTQFDWRGEASVSLRDADEVQTSPFAPESSNEENYNLGLEKLWSSGLETAIDYSLVDSLTVFPGQDDADFLQPELSFTLTTNVFQDLLSDRLSLVEPQLAKEKKSLSMESKIRKKTVLVNALLELASILETIDEIGLEKELCAEIARQTEKVRQRRQRRSVSQREFLQSQQDLVICRATIKTLEKDLLEQKANLAVVYGVEVGPLLQLEVEQVFAEVSSWFQGGRFDPASVNLDDVDDLALLKLDYEVSQIEQKQLDALKRTDLSMSLQAGLQGLQDDLGSAHEDLTEFNFPYILASITLSFPFAQRDAEINSSVNRLQAESLQLQIEQTRKEKKSRLDTLSESLRRDFIIYGDYQRNVQLAEGVLREARKDFNNGRIDFSTLSEFQRGLIESRRQLAGLRVQIVINTVEYVDYFRFFDTYF